jgi:two-component system, LytTR family, sensor histidine kinase AlgZ
MHPVLASRGRLGAYLLAWIPGVALLVGPLMAEGWRFRHAVVLSVPACLFASTLFLFRWYLCRSVPLRGRQPFSLLGIWTAAAVIMGVLWSGMTQLLFSLLSDLSLLGPETLTRSTGLGLAGAGAVFYIITVAYHYLIIAQEQTQEAERTEQGLRELAREAELKALRAQLNPHFLFNSLNSISALTSIDPKGARRMCVLLADFLRKSLKLGEHPLVTLAEELDLLRAYLSIEQIRFGQRLRLDWAVETEVEGIIIPALLLQPLVENAIKHGIANLPEGGSLRIAAFKRNDLVEIHVENERDPEAGTPQGLGMGLQQVKQRLRGRFGADVFFEAGIRESRFEVVMAFPGDKFHE